MAKFKPPFPAFGTQPPQSGVNPFAKKGKMVKKTKVVVKKKGGKKGKRK